ncbi:hypothetical protein VNO80_30536 [Phaseolus coccineus]|uniref:Uncharacterized protein n=1 Tax=Phaseolus coccineus TaxID=3886 RepID=A0AAN9LGH4_PHACN
MNIDFIVNDYVEPIHTNDIGFIDLVNDFTDKLDYEIVVSTDPMYAFAQTNGDICTDFIIANDILKPYNDCTHDANVAYTNPELEFLNLVNFLKWKNSQIAVTAIVPYVKK